jgi:hypothetical protein
MLYESDAAIARRDPVLPELATLLDPVAFGEALRRASSAIGNRTGLIASNEQWRAPKPS